MGLEGGAHVQFHDGMWLGKTLGYLKALDESLNHGSPDQRRVVFNNFPREYPSIRSRLRELGYRYVDSEILANISTAFDYCFAIMHICESQGSVPNEEDVQPQA